jgi:hypothetical protein
MFDCSATSSDRNRRSGRFVTSLVIELFESSFVASDSFARLGRELKLGAFNTEHDAMHKTQK